MWRKSSEEKPNKAASNTPAPAPAKAEETPQVTSQSSAPTSAREQTSPAPQAAAMASPAPAPAIKPTNSTPSKIVAAAPGPERAASNGTSTISAGLKIKGEITGTSDLTIEGETEGKVWLVNGRVTVAASGRAKADIEAREIVINGTVQGSLKASESVRLGPASWVEGSVLTPRIGIDDGARLRGKVEMVRAGETPESAKEPAKSAQAVRAASASALED
jgi:cytoskeletal protein CcmA (bactofilin family)